MEWKKIDGYVNYECSNTGLIKTYNWKNTGREKIMKPALDKNGYLRTVLKRNDGKLCTIKVHRIICETFKGKKKNLCVNHINFDRADNKIENLEWVTIKENNLHSLKNNNFVNGQFVGEKHYKSILTENEVIDLRKNYIRGKKGYKKEMSQKYKVSEATIKDIIQNRSWKHLV